MVKTAGFGGYLLQIIYKTSAGAAVLTYIVFLCLLVPFPSSDNFKVNQTFGTPKDHRKAKPYHDHVFAFSLLDEHIWFQNYQISVPHNETDKVDRGGLDKMILVEVGPRFCLNPIKIFAGSFGGPTLYDNPYYISSNEVALCFSQALNPMGTSLVLGMALVNPFLRSGCESQKFCFHKNVPLVVQNT